MLNAHQPASALAVVMCIELKRECVSPAFVIGSGLLTRALVPSVFQPAATQDIERKFDNSFILALSEVRVC